MNLTSRRARTLFVLCSVGAVVGAGVSATNAFAVGESLAFGPTATSATIVNVDPGASAAKALATYGVKVTGTLANDANPLRLQVLTGPSAPGSGVLFENVAGNGTPTNVRAYQPVFTTMTADSAISATTITVASTTGFSTGDWVAIQASGTNTEYRKVTVTNATTLTVAALQAAHLTGATVTDYGATTASTTTTADPAAGAVSLQVGSSAGMVAGHWLYIGGDTPGHAEYRKVTGASDGTHVEVAAISATDGDHGNGALVVDLGTTAGVGMTAQSAAGATSITVADTTGLAVGREIVIDGAIPETAQISALPGAGVVTLEDPLVYTHPLGSFVLNKGDGTSDNIFIPVPVGGSRVNLSYDATTNVDNMYLGALVPGAYTLRFFKDRNANKVYDATQDDATPVFTLNVKDITGSTTETTDDWSPSVTVPSSVVQGLTVPVSIATNGLSLSDTRGANAGTGVGKLGEAIAGTLGVTFSGNAASGPTAPTFDGTSFTISSNATSGTTAEGISITGLAASAVTRSVAVTDNLVTTMTAAATDVVGSAKFTAPNVAVKAGTATVAYTSTVTNGIADKSGKTVYFTLTPGTNTPVLTADGSLVSSNATTGVKVYSAVTNATGVATLNVTSATTTAGTTYTVAPATNTAVVTNPTLTATYAAAAASTFTLTTPTASMYPTVGGNVAIAGTLNDQFGAAFQPALSATQQVTVTIDQNNTSYGSADVTGYATLTGGAFSYTYTPTTAATVGQQDVVQFAYGSVTDSTNSVYWTSATAPTSVTITAPVASSAQPQQKATVTLTKAGAALGTAITGSVLDAASAGLPYKSVTLTGTPGVYFSTSNNPGTTAVDDLKTTITAAANSTGAYSGVVAFFTKAGNATITATSGTATATVTVSVTQDADPYTVTVTGTTVAPGGTSVVTGTATNGFGHPVSGTAVNLSLGTSTIATLGATSVNTNSEGVWSTTITGASAGTGDATLTATLGTQTANATPETTWLTKGGLTIATGVYQATATVTVDPTINQTTVTAPASRVGAGYVTLSGTAKPATSVEIYGKATASSAAYGLVGLVTSAADGSWSTSQYISATSTFFAKTSVSTSSTITVTVTPRVVPAPAPARLTVSLGATATGNRHVRLAANGGPVGRGTLKYYRYNGHGWVLLRTVRANTRGDATITVSSPRGNQTFRVVYSVTGRGAVGANKAVRVR